MSQKIDDTILKMVKDLKGSGKGEESRKFATPLKRSLSSNNSIESSSDDMTPVKKFKVDNSFDLSYMGSPREVRRLRVDLVETRNTVKCLEERISQMHSVRNEMQLMFENENQTLKRQHEHDRKTIEDLEMQLQIVRKREADLKQEHLELKSQLRDLKVSKDDEISRLEKDLSDIKEESRCYESEDNIELSKLKRKIIDLETMLNAANEDVEAHRKLVEELGKQLSEKNAVERELELKSMSLLKAKNQIKELESAKDNYMEYQEQAKTQQNKLIRYAELERENEQLMTENLRLKDEIGNKLLLEEEVYDIRSRLAKFKDIEKELLELQVKNSQNQLYLNEWHAVARGICETTEDNALLPHLLRQVVERLQQQELTLTTEKVEFESQFKSAEHAAKVAKMELEKNQKLLGELKQTNDQRQSIIHRMQKKLLLVSRERDSYRAQLDSYEKDLTIVSTTPGLAVHGQKERIENLEKIVEGYRDMVTKLEADLQAVQPDSQAEMVPARAEHLARLEDEARKLKQENAKLREMKDRLEIQLEGYLEGHDTLQGGQILHLAKNPLSECLAARENLVEQLQQEIVRLKNKVKKLEEGAETSKLGDISICPKEMQILKEKISSHEKQTQRLKDYFKSSMQEFRNVIYMLLGYKIDKTSPSNVYKLRSMYAESPDDQLCFQVNPDGDLNLLENEFSATLGQMIDLHLRHQKSIPVFLSAITMDLFNSRTMTKTFSSV